jgi:hypothetical protein
MSQKASGDLEVRGIGCANMYSRQLRVGQQSLIVYPIVHGTEFLLALSQHSRRVVDDSVELDPSRSLAHV